MNAHAEVTCTIAGLRAQRYGSQVVSFNAGSDVSLRLKGTVGPRGIGEAGADLLDFAIAVYQIERQLGGRQRTNPPRSFRVEMPLRRPDKWTRAARQIASDALHLLGNAKWELELRPGLRTPVVPHESSDQRSIDRICLFSGGMDSACGAAVIAGEAETVQLVSSYTRQMSLQQELASDLGHRPPVQFGQQWAGTRGRGRSFYYRAFLFLTLGAVIADSWGARTVLQYENGVLATAIPPHPSWKMTRHAHPAVHEALGNLFGMLLGGEWRIENPFLTKTKREACVQACDSIGKTGMHRLLGRTQTCWSYYQSRAWGEKKKPGQPCGVCIPCLVRRTALPRERGHQFDLREDAVKNHENRGRAFRSYFSFLDRVRREGADPDAFYALLPAVGKRLTWDDLVCLEGLQRLFRTFEREFRNTFRIKS